jgi:hypothetical protein
MHETAKSVVDWPGGILAILTADLTFVPELIVSQFERDECGQNKHRIEHDD